jgi:hypothetical protein
MEVTVTRGNKGQDAGSPEKWAHGRTLDSITEMRLSAEDVSEAAQLIAAPNDQTGANLAEELQSIARRYWEQHRNSERPAADWYRTKVGRIQKEAENLLKLLREPHGTALSKLRFRTEQRMGLHLLGSVRQEPLSIEQLLDDFVAVCKSCTFKSAKGAPNKTHIKAAVASLREVWSKFTGKPFPLNLQSGDNRKDRSGQLWKKQDRDDAFTSPGPRFVQVVMRRIDPTVPIGAIRTALRDALVNARPVD